MARRLFGANVAFWAMNSRVRWGGMTGTFGSTQPDRHVPGQDKQRPKGDAQVGCPLAATSA